MSVYARHILPYSESYSVVGRAEAAKEETAALGSSLDWQHASRAQAYRKVAPLPTLPLGRRGPHKAANECRAADGKFVDFGNGYFGALWHLACALFFHRGSLRDSRGQSWQHCRGCKDPLRGLRLRAPLLGRLLVICGESGASIYPIEAKRRPETGLGKGLGCSIAACFSSLLARIRQHLLTSLLRRKN